MAGSSNAYLSAPAVLCCVGLWSAHADLHACAIVATAAPAHLRKNCFNGGMLLVRPNADIFRRIEKAVVANLPNPECPLGFDQPVLTRIFRKKWRPIANWTQLKATTKCMRKNKIPPQIDAVTNAVNSTE